MPERFRVDEKPQVYFLRHTLGVNDFLIGLELLAETYPAIRVHQVLHERELKGMPVRVAVPVEQGQGSETVTLIPDAWMDIRISGVPSPILLELDRGTVGLHRWRQRIRAYCEFVRGPYQATYGSDAVVIATLTTSSQRQTELCRLTDHVLTQTGQADLAELFLFSCIPPQTDPEALFLSRIWQSSFLQTSSSLLEDASPVGMTG